MENFSEKVLVFATKKHEGQVRKFTGEPYINHPIAVADLVVKEVTQMDYCPLINPIEVYKSVAYLHDVLEDTQTNEQELWEFLSSIIEDTFDKNSIYKNIKRLTRRNDMNIIDYLKNVKLSIISTRVKLADLQHNMSDLKPGNLLDKYNLCKYFLTR